MKKEYKTLDEVKEEKENIKKQYQELSTLNCKLDEIEKELRSKNILESKVLSKTKWKVCIGRRNNLYLDGEHNEDIISLADFDHGSIDITDEISLVIDDSEFYLNFDDQSLIKKFIDDNNLDVDLNPIEIISLKNSRDEIIGQILELEKILGKLK